MENLKGCENIQASTIHVVALGMSTRARSKYVLVRVPKCEHPNPSVCQGTEAHRALEVAMNAIPSASEGRYVGPATRAQIESMPPNVDIIEI